MGLGHECDCREFESDRATDVRGTSILGSLNRAAVAGTVRGIKNPLSGRFEEYTANTTAPGIPLTKIPISAATSAF